MGYAHIENLYKNQSILLLKECYALEKIHGTSAHIKFDPEGEQFLTFFSGGEKYENFVKLFDEDSLLDLFKDTFVDSKVTIYGEAYGGKQQGMSKTYGAELKFIAFEVKIGDTWLCVPNAHDVCLKFGIEFVDYVRIPTSLESIDAERDKDSTQAKRNGLGEGIMREGIVLKPLVELNTSNGARIMAKHKRAEFSETKTPREVNPDKLQIMLNSQKIADEWVTEMRLQHVLDKLPNVLGIEHTGKIILAMVEDVYREAKGEIIESKAVQNAISKKTAQMWKSKLQKELYIEA